MDKENPRPNKTQTWKSGILKEGQQISYTWTAAKPLTWPDSTPLSLNWREMDLKAEQFSGWEIGWLVTARGLRPVMRGDPSGLSWACCSSLSLSGLNATSVSLLTPSWVVQLTPRKKHHPKGPVKLGKWAHRNLMRFNKAKYCIWVKAIPDLSRDWEKNSRAALQRLGGLGGWEAGHEKLARRGCGCPVPGGVQGQVEWAAWSSIRYGGWRPACGRVGGVWWSLRTLSAKSILSLWWASSVLLQPRMPTASWAASTEGGQWAGGDCPPSALPLWGPTCGTASSPGGPSTKRMWSWWSWPKRGPPGCSGLEHLSCEDRPRELGLFTV